VIGVTTFDLQPRAMTGFHRLQTDVRHAAERHGGLYQSGALRSAKVTMPNMPNLRITPARTAEECDFANPERQRSAPHGRW
jgi:hypothetical protein